MTRLDEIKKKMLELEEETPNWEDTTVYVAGFLDGAMWADQHPHWISVEDELPPLNEDVIVCFGVNQDVTVGIDRRIQNIEDNGFVDWELIVGITHWMPLPQAPKKGGEE